MYYQGDQVLNNKRELDVTQLNYEYEWLDWKKAASNRMGEGSRASLINKEERNIYPDTLVWIRDFSYSYNEPFTRNYFWHPAYDDYPVVGVDWKQAKAFAYWRTSLWNKYKDASVNTCLLYTSPSPRDLSTSRMPSSA